MIWNFIKKKQIGIFGGAIVLIAISAIVIFSVHREARIEINTNFDLTAMNDLLQRRAEILKAEAELGKEKSEYVYKPGPISMKAMKTQGCVADGLLSGYGGDIKESVAMIKRSNCVYLHRALETWGETPNFEKANKILERIDKPGLIYGMFIAEAIKRNASYPENGEEKEFDFSKMCKADSKNSYGAYTCIPELSSGEYREYLRYITQRAMDIGIQSFIFGQIYLQGNTGLAKERMPKIVEEMRAYAKKKGIEIVVGAQTGTITDEEFLKLFDYIEGGVGIGDNGVIEDGPCWSHLESCWALLWNDRYAKQANNVFLHLDWSGLNFDDMSSFARMDKNKRAETLKKLYSYFTGKNMGFLMPFMATLDKNNNGCRGPSKRFYSASNDYTCQDEDTINALLGGNK